MENDCCYEDLCLSQKDSGFILSYREKVKLSPMAIRSVYDPEYDYKYVEEAFGEKQIAQALAKFSKLASMRTAKK